MKNLIIKRQLSIDLRLSFSSIALLLLATSSVQANPNLAEELDLPPGVVENSPVLQQWGKEIPNLLEEIKTDPSFKTKINVGYLQYPSTDDISGWKIGIEDVFVGKTQLTVNANYSQSFNHERRHLETNLAYSLFPLGSYFNVSPVVGYHVLETEKYEEEGLNLGLQIRLVLSRTDAADIRLSQTFISPGQETEVGLTTLNTGYSLTENFRVAVEIQKQNATVAKDSRVGVLTQWTLP